jgi:hypothetical protein
VGSGNNNKEYVMNATAPINFHNLTIMGGGNPPQASGNSSNNGRPPGTAVGGVRGGGSGPNH